MFTPDIFEVNMRMLADARMSIYRKYPPPEQSVESLYRLSQRTEVKGPSTSGMLAKAEDFGLSPAGTILIAHAPHRCSLPVDTPFRHLSFQFGILPGNITTGVKFQVSVREATGTATPLWSRVLDPIHRPGDQGIQQIQVPVNLSIPPGADLVFETLPWPGNNNFGAWSFWGGVRLEN
jgi:hypothetical protein